MLRFITFALFLVLFVCGLSLHAQENDTVADPLSIEGTWITQSGNLVEVELDGTEVTLYFTEYARYKTASFSGLVFVYITHYNDPDREECYINVPESEFNACQRFIQDGDPRHRFTLTLSDDGMVLSGVKELNVLQCEWDTDENGNTSNHRPAGYMWTYETDYTWRRANCDFNGFPPLNGNAIEKFELIGAILDRFDLAAEFSLGVFEPRERVRFVYAQSYLDADDGTFVPAQSASQHAHLEPLDGRVYLDPDSGQYVMDLYPYAFQSYVSLLTSLTILGYQIHALEEDGTGMEAPTTRMEIESVDYAWSHRQALCSHEDEMFDHHIDFLSRALHYRALDED